MEYACPHCKNPIYDDDALLCLYCGESLKRPIGQFGRIHKNPTKLIFAIIVLLVLLGFLKLLF